MIVRSSLVGQPTRDGYFYEMGHGLLQKGAIWHCRWQFVPPGETSDSPLACRSRDPAGQRSAEAPPSLGWQAHRDPQPRTSLQQQQVRGSRDSGSIASKEQERKTRNTGTPGTQPWKARHGQVGGESCM